MQTTNNENITSFEASSFSNLYKLPWYYSTEIIAILSALWVFIAPLIAAIILLVARRSEIKKRKNTLASLSKFEKIYNLQEKEDTLIAGINEHEKKLNELNENIAQKSKELISVDENLELESFALYHPKFQFTHVAEYQEQLLRIRDLQKREILNGSAVPGGEGWTLNNSAAQGKKMVSDTKKLLLRAFNNECDAAVNSVKFNNYDRCLTRIQKSADAINKLGKMMHIFISSYYIDLKKQELQIALEYQLKKQQEKEEQKELREQQREAAKLEKELAEKRKITQKEQTHYSNALAEIEDRIQHETSPDILQELEAKKSELIEHLEVIDQQLKDIDYREANQRAGYVYVISNIGAFGKDVYKIGMTRRLNPQERIDELGDASVPFSFDVHAMIFSEDAPKLESALHQTFDEKKVNLVNNRKEFFRVSLDEIKQAIKENFDKTVEFVDTPEAEQYRETLLLQSHSEKYSA